MVKKIILKEESFEYAVYLKLSPAIKCFLSAYLGNKLQNLEAECYSEIEMAIQENIYNIASQIPDILYNHRTIKDADEFDIALDKFTKPEIRIHWTKTKHWFDRDFNITADDDDTFLEDTYNFDLNATEQYAKGLVEAANRVINNAETFAHFIQTGYQALNFAARQFLEEYAIFDLTILSAKGFILLQNNIDLMNEMILEDLFAIVQ